jgi:hypothetical protein
MLGSNIHLTAIFSQTSMKMMTYGDEWTLTQGINPIFIPKHS